MTSSQKTTLCAVRLAHFKRFANETFELRPLTLLTGLNGTGKSTLIQGLLLAFSALHSGTGGFLALNHPWLVLGQADDVFTFGEEAAEIEFGLIFTDKVECSVRLTRIAKDQLRLSVQTSMSAGELKERYKEIVDSPLYAYLCAERLGPRLSLPLASHGEGAFMVGAHGEYTAQFLLEHGATHQVREHRRHVSNRSSDDDEQPITLLKQAERWMSELVPGLEVKPLPITEALQSALSFTTGDLKSNWVRPLNMGFGVSYALPIIVEGLAIAPGRVMIVENPEAHLHPAGQSAMGRFLGLLAADGVQVIVETHSDHVLNGICLAAIDDRHPLKRQDVLIHAFLNEPRDGARILAIEINKQGGFTQNPPGFFDQSANDLRAILQARSPAAQLAKKLNDRAAVRSPSTGQDE